MMPLISIEEIIEFILYGVIGWLLIFSFITTPARPSSKVDRVLFENKKLAKQAIHSFGQSRILEDANGSLRSALSSLEKRFNESQLAQAKLNDELVRRGNQIRSLEFALHLERNGYKGRR